MKSKLAVAGALFMCLFIAPAYAQWVTHAKAEVPFEFTIGQTVLPAGNYVVQIQGTSPSLLKILNVGTQQSAMVQERDILLRSGYGMSPKTKLVFSRDGNRRVLHQVVFERDNHMHDIVHGTQVAELVTPR
jgi:hypothetical protein